MANKESKTPATIIILEALIPYTQQNLKLSFYASQFFNELEQNSKYSSATLRQSFARLKDKGYIDDGEIPTLTAKGRRHVQPFVAKQLNGETQLMVIFDIPEDFGSQRRQLRNLLRQLGFVQVQRSVWVSRNDHTQILREFMAELRLDDWVVLYEVAPIL